MTPYNTVILSQYNGVKCQSCNWWSAQGPDADTQTFNFCIVCIFWWWLFSGVKSSGGTESKMALHTVSGFSQLHKVTIWFTFSAELWFSSNPFLISANRQQKESVLGSVSQKLNDNDFLCKPALDNQAVSKINLQTPGQKRVKFLAPNPNILNRLELIVLSSW